MNFNALLTVTAIVAGISGLGLLIAPVGMQQPLASPLNKLRRRQYRPPPWGLHGLVCNRVLGHARHFLRGNESISAKAVSATFVLGTVVMMMLQLNQAFGPLGGVSLPSTRCSCWRMGILIWQGCLWRSCRFAARFSPSIRLHGLTRSR